MVRAAGRGRRGGPVPLRRRPAGLRPGDGAGCARARCAPGSRSSIPGAGPSSPACCPSCSSRRRTPRSPCRSRPTSTACGCSTRSPTPCSPRPRRGCWCSTTCSTSTGRPAGSCTTSCAASPPPGCSSPRRPVVRRSTATIPRRSCWPGCTRSTGAPRSSWAASTGPRPTLLARELGGAPLDARAPVRRDRGQPAVRRRGPAAGPAARRSASACRPFSRPGSRSSPAPARALAEVAATIGREFRVDVLAAAAGEADDALLDGLDELWRRRILREQDAHGLPVQPRQAPRGRRARRQPAAHGGCCTCASRPPSNTPTPPTWARSAPRSPGTTPKAARRATPSPGTGAPPRPHRSCTRAMPPSTSSNGRCARSARCRPRGVATPPSWSCTTRSSARSRRSRATSPPRSRRTSRRRSRLTAALDVPQAPPLLRSLGMSALTARGLPGHVAHRRRSCRPRASASARRCSSSRAPTCWGWRRSGKPTSPPPASTSRRPSPATGPPTSRPTSSATARTRRWRASPGSATPCGSWASPTRRSGPATTPSPGPSRSRSRSAPASRCSSARCWPSTWTTSPPCASSSRGWRRSEPKPPPIQLSADALVGYLAVLDGAATAGLAAIDAAIRAAEARSPAPGTPAILARIRLAAAVAAGDPRTVARGGDALLAMGGAAAVWARRRPVASPQRSRSAAR